MGNPVALMVGIALGNVLYSGLFRKDWPRAIGTSYIAAILILILYTLGWW